MQTRNFPEILDFSAHIMMILQVRIGRDSRFRRTGHIFGLERSHGTGVQTSSAGHH